MSVQSAIARSAVPFERKRKGSRAALTLVAVLHALKGLLALTASSG